MSRSGLIAKKVGMTRMFDTEGNHIPVTVLRMSKCQVVTLKTSEKDGYSAVQLGMEEAKPNRVTKPLKGHFAKNKVSPMKHLKEFHITDETSLEVGTELSVDHFVAGQHVDVIGRSKGKGFAGAMKRHGFGGLRASHGVSVSHRSHGSTGHCQDPGRVFPGKKMAGHMGDEKVTMQNLKIVTVDTENGLLFIKGGIPGAKGGVVYIRDSIKKERPDNVPMPAGIIVKSQASKNVDKSSKNENKEDNKTNNKEA